MPYYPYVCNDCGHEFEVVKSVKAIDDPEHCQVCNALSDRVIAKTGGFIGASDWDTAHYNPAFGKVMKSNAEARREAKRMGLEEVGNEPVDNIHKKFDGDREKKINDRWNSLNNHGEIKTK